MDKLLGSERILYLKIGQDYFMVGCLKSNSFSESTDMLPTTTRANQGWETSRPNNQRYSIEFNGIQIKSEVGVSPISYNLIKSLKRDRILTPWKIEYLSQGMFDLGEGHITDLSEAAETGDFLTFTGRLEGFGAPTEETDTQKPSTPFLTLAGQDSERILLEWTESTDNKLVSGYQLYRDDALYATVGAVTEFEDYGIVDGEKYSYNVRAFDSSGNFSPLSNKVLSGTVSKPGEEAYLFQNEEAFLFQDGKIFNYQ